jgi:hypothetical protein
MSWVHLVGLFVIAGSTIIYTSSDVESILIFGNITKIFSLFVAGFSLTMTQNAYATGDTPKKAWTYLASGMWLWMLGQLLFAFYKIFLRQDLYPSIADIYFSLGYAPLFLGLIVLIGDFKSTGLPMGSARSYLIQGVILALAYAGIFFNFLLPLLRTDDSAGAKFLNVGYPTSDFLLFATTTVLIRISWVLRGGSLARSWIMLGAGFITIAVADVIFAYRPSPVVDILFFTSYFLIAVSGVHQLQMLKQR